MRNTKAKTLVEAAMLIAVAQLLSYLVLYRFPQGGAIDAAMLPIILFSIRHGAGWGTMAGLVFGPLQYIGGNGIAIDWTSMVADYLIAYALLGFGAGLAKGRRHAIYTGTLLGALLRFLAHYAVGAVVWGKYMPEVFFGMTMTTPWFYSLLYNAPYMLGSTVIVLILAALLEKRMGRYFRGEDLTL